MRFTSVLLSAVAFLMTSEAFVPSVNKPAFGGSISTSSSASVLGSSKLSAVSVDSSSSGATETATETTVAAVPKKSQRWRKKTKQVATLGPASSSVEMIETLFLAGADVFRLNFSHGSQEQKKELYDMIRSVEEKYSHPIAILGDLQGPKLRVSEYLFFASYELSVRKNHQ